ncbi:MAG: hypothetical protein QW472_02700 [Candidatus Aenigmatarchaeota archaeon]
MQKDYANLRIIGVITIGIAIALIVVVFSLTQTVLKYGEELHKTCPLPPEICPIKRGTLPAESLIGFIFSAGLIGVGLYLLLFVRSVQITGKELTKFKRIAKTLQGNERKVYELVIGAGGSIFQGDLISKTGFSKVKVSRILDRLETNGLIERRRRGMVNLIVLKE